VIQGAIFLAEEKVHRSQRCKNKQRTVNTEKNTPDRDQLQTSLEHTLFTASLVCRNTHTVGTTAKLCEFDMVLVHGDTARGSTNKKNPGRNGFKKHRNYFLVFGCTM
jgi:hypothetical protein